MIKSIACIFIGAFTLAWVALVITGFFYAFSGIAYLLHTKPGNLFFGTLFLLLCGVLGGIIMDCSD